VTCTFGGLLGSDRPIPHIIQKLNKLFDFRKREQTVDALIVQVSEWTFIKTARIHDAALGQVGDYQINKFDLIGRQRAPIHKFAKRALELGVRLFPFFEEIKYADQLEVAATVSRQ